MILYAEDRNIIVDIVMLYLKKENFSVTHFFDGEGAWNEFKANPNKYSLLITDNDMALYISRQGNAIHHTHVMHTASPNFIELEHIDYIVRNKDVEVLIEIVKKALG